MFTFFGHFWPPTYPLLTLVDIWDTTYLLSTLTFQKIPPFSTPPTMHHILIRWSCRIIYWNQTKINEWKTSSFFPQHLFFTMKLNISFKNSEKFFENVNVDIEYTTYLPMVDIRWHFMKYLPTSSCKRSFRTAPIVHVCHKVVCGIF